MRTLDLYARTSADLTFDHTAQVSESGPVIALTDATARMHIRKYAMAVVAVSVSSPDDGITILQSSIGTMTITISREKLRNLGSGNFEHDCVAEFPDGRMVPIFYGKMTIDEGVTR